ncbi:MAG: tetratricopeptide repeat protein [Byssovorax sp.]
MSALRYAAAALLLFSAGPALAQPSSSKALLEEGVALMDAGKFDEACPKLARSQEIEPDMKTEFRLGQCYEKLGKTATAWRLYREVVDLAHRASRPDREDFARKAAEAIEAKLARIVVLVPAEVASLPGLTVEVDGSAVERAVWERGAPVDPGDHRLVVVAEGRRAWAGRRSVKAAEKAEVRVPALEIGHGPPVEELGRAGDELSSRPSVIPGIALGAGAIAGFAAGAALLVVSSGKAGDATTLSDTIGRGGCSRTPPDGRCAELTDMARQVDTLHDAGVGVMIGAAGLTAGAASYFLWRALKGPSSTPGSSDDPYGRLDVRAAPMVGAGRGGLVITGAF